MVRLKTAERDKDKKDEVAETIIAKPLVDDAWDTYITVPYVSQALF